MPVDPQTRRVIRRVPLPVALALGAMACAARPGESPPSPDSSPVPPRPTLGAVSGELRLVKRPGPPVDLRPVVVILDPAAVPANPPTRTVRVVSPADEFAPEFAAIGPGDSLVFVNRGRLRHRVFTAGADGDVAREVPPGSASEPLVLKKYGPVRFFCSLHPDETFLLYIAPTPYFALLSPAGGYRIRGLPAGEYRLAIWSPRVTGTVREFQVVAGRASREQIWIDPLLLTR